jgi:hypothetical protein
LMLTVLTSATMAMIGNDRTSNPSRTNSMERPRWRESMPAGRLSKARAGAAHRSARALVALSPAKVQGFTPTRTPTARFTDRR